MKSNYKRLGDYIESVNRRNVECEITDLRGLSLTKEFRKSTSNIVGTDMSTYKIMHKYDFAANFMGLGVLVDKAAIVLKMDETPNIVSGAYPVFKVKNENVLHPEYLMMWLIRGEFDRFCVFKSDSGIRGGFDWADLLEISIPVPSINKQKEVVNEYNVVKNRINLNQQLIKKLEQTATAIYKQWFVDFEFPDESGKPYKSNNGKMRVSELGEIPTDWETRSMSSLCQITSSKRIFESDYKKVGVPFYRAGEIKQKKEGIQIKELLYIAEEQFLKISKSYGHPLQGDILLTAVGSLLGDSYLVDNETFYFKDGNVIWFRNFKEDFINLYIYEYLQSSYFKEFLEEITIGSGQNAITIQSLNEKILIKPNDMVLKKFNKISLILNNRVAILKKQNSLLYEMKDLLLSKIAKIEN
jgi:type I restriction enzyme S subunit